MTSTQPKCLRSSLPKSNLLNINSSSSDNNNSNKKIKNTNTKTVKSIFKEGFLNENTDQIQNKQEINKINSTQKQNSKSSISSTSTNSSTTSNTTTKKKDDGPGPEPKTIKEFDATRKILIFNKEAINDKKFITKFILSNQEKLNKEYNSSKKSSFWKSTNQQIYDFVVIFKACMANYLLVLHLYNINNNQYEELQLFLFILQQNKDKFDFIYQKIEENILKMQSSNRIAKYYPGLIKMFMEILSVFIKLSAKFYKADYMNYFLRLYMRILIYLLIAFKDALNSNFIGDALENEMRTASRYFYANCLNYLAIFHFYKYQPLYISNKIFKHIFTLYEGLNNSELLNREHIFLLTIHYNYGLLLHLDGNSINSISQLKKASYIISQIKYAVEKEQINPKKSEVEKKSPKNPKKRSRVETQNNKNNISTCISVAVTGSKADDDETQRVKTLLNTDADVNIRNCSIINLNKKKIIILHDPIEFSLSKNQEYDKEKLLVQLELLLCDIELEQKNYNESFRHLNNIMSKFKKQYSKKNVRKTKTSITSNQSDINFLNDSIDVNFKSNSIVNIDISRMTQENFSLILSEEDIKNINILLEKNKKENNDKDEDMSIKHYDISTYNKEKNVSNEIEKFFLFLCGLSVYQLNLLNKSQPNKGNKRNDLPILFSSQFKDCLSNSQRNTLKLLEALNLSRYIILNQPNGDICPENINFHFLNKLNKNIDNKNINIKNKKNVNELRTSCPKQLKLKLKMDIDYCINELPEKNIEEGENESNSNGKINEENKISDEFLILQNNCKNGDWEIVTRSKTKILKLLNNLKEKERKLLIESPEWNEFLLKTLQSKND